MLPWLFFSAACVPDKAGQTNANEIITLKAPAIAWSTKAMFQWVKTLTAHTVHLHLEHMIYRTSYLQISHFRLGQNQAMGWNRLPQHFMIKWFSTVCDFSTLDIQCCQHRCYTMWIQQLSPSVLTIVELQLSLCNMHQGTTQPKLVQPTWQHHLIR